MHDRAKYPAEMIGKLLARGDPEDDRIWLARANRAILSGHPDEAALARPVQGPPAG